MPKILVTQKTRVPVKVGTQGPQGPPGPQGPSGNDATLPQTATQAEMEAGTEAALRMMSPALVADAIAALGGGGGGGGMWEPVVSVEVTASGISSIDFTGLDGDLYDYRVQLYFKPNGGSCFLYYNGGNIVDANRLLVSLINGTFSAGQYGPSSLTGYSSTQFAIGAAEVRTSFDSGGNRWVTQDMDLACGPYGYHQLRRLHHQGTMLSKLSQLNFTMLSGTHSIGNKFELYRRIRI